MVFIDSAIILGVFDYIKRLGGLIYIINKIRVDNNMTEAIFSKKETILKNENARLLTLQVQRVPDGIRLYAKSPTFERYFESNSSVQDPEDYPDWDGKHAYHLRDSLPPNEFRAMINAWGGNYLIFMHRDPSGNHALDKQIPNLSFLRAEGLKDGLIFTIPTVLSKTQVAEFMTLAKDYTQKLYKDFMKPVGMSLEILMDDNVGAN